MAKKYIIDLLVNADGSVKSVNGVKGVLGELKKTADNVTGGMITKFQNFGKSVTGAGKGLSGVTKALKVMKAALIATGIGAIVVAFGSLVTFLTSTQRGMDKVSKVTAALGATFDVLKDRISGIGEAVALFFSGKPSAAFDKLKESVTGVTDEIIRETNAAYKLKEALIALEDTEIGLIATTAERRKEIAAARLAAEDETLSFTERIAALDRAAKLETEILDEQLRIAKERAKISEEQLALGESSREDIRKNEEAQARVFQLEERSLQLRKSLSTRRNALVRQEQTENDALIASRQVTSVMETDLMQKGAEQSTITTATIVNNTQKQQEQQLLTNQVEDQIAQQKIQRGHMLVDALSQFAGAETGIGKALLIAKQALALQESLMDIKRITFKGTQAIGEAGVATAQNVAESSKIGFPQNIITIAGAIAQGVSIIRSVKSAVSKTKAQASAAAATVAQPPRVSTPAGAETQSPAFNIVGSTGTNQLAAAIGGQAQQPVKAFVVSQDVTTAQELERKTVQGASIG